MDNVKISVYTTSMRLKRWMWTVGILLLPTSFVAAESGLVVEYDVPCPRNYRIRYGRGGTPYVVVTEFGRRQTGSLSRVRVRTGGGARSAGVVHHVRRSRSGGAHVVLRAANGLTFGVRTGDTFTFGGRRFLASGFDDDVYVLTCSETGARFTFVRR